MRVESNSAAPIARERAAAARSFWNGGDCVAGVDMALAWRSSGDRGADLTALARAAPSGIQRVILEIHRRPRAPASHRRRIDPRSIPVTPSLERLQRLFVILQRLFVIDLAMSTAAVVFPAVVSAHQRIACHMSLRQQRITVRASAIGHMRIIAQPNHHEVHIGDTSGHRHLGIGHFLHNPE